LFELRLLKIPIHQIYFLNQDYICIAFSTHIMAVGPIFTSPNHGSANYIRTLGDSGLLK